MFCVYILQSQQDRSYYVGQTDNIERRLEEHNRSKNIYTKGKAPWNLVYKEFYNTRSDAMQREIEIKRKKRKTYLEWLITKHVD